MNIRSAIQSNLENSRSPRRSRAGFSLLEIILVTTLMVIIAAMTLPSMQNFFISQKLEKGADRVRTEMGKARVNAIRTGEIYAFMFRPGMTQYAVVPFNDAFQESSYIREEQVGGLDNRISDFSFEIDRLPRGTIFVEADAIEGARAAQAMADNQVNLSEMTPVLFYPDGSSQDAVLILRNERNEEVKVTVRGLTGQSSVQIYNR